MSLLNTGTVIRQDHYFMLAGHPTSVMSWIRPFDRMSTRYWWIFYETNTFFSLPILHTISPMLLVRSSRKMRPKLMASIISTLWKSTRLVPSRKWSSSVCWRDLLKTPSQLNLQQPIPTVWWVAWCKILLLRFLVLTKRWVLPKSWSTSPQTATDESCLLLRWTGMSNPWSTRSLSSIQHRLVTPSVSFLSRPSWRKLWANSVRWVVVSDLCWTRWVYALLSIAHNYGIPIPII